MAWVEERVAGEEQVTLDNSIEEKSFNENERHGMVVWGMGLAFKNIAVEMMVRFCSDGKIQ